MSLHLTDDTTEEIKLRKGKTRVLHLKPGQHWRTLPEEWKNRSVFYNGTLRIDSSTETDSGEYQLETYTRNGTLLHRVNMRLVVQGTQPPPQYSNMT